MMYFRLQGGMIQVYEIPNGDDESLHEFFNPVPSQSRMKREN